MQIVKTVLFGGTLFGAAVMAQDLTPLQLRSACQSAPQNTVVVNSPIKVANYTPRVNVSTGCRIVFGATGKLEMDSINMGFAGPLVLQGGVTSGAILVKSLVEAPSVRVDLSGGDNIVSLGESTLRATSGDVAINVGQNSKLDVASRFTGRAHALIAAGSIQVTGGFKFDASFSDTSASGNGGITVSGAGDEMTLNAGNSNLISTAGAVAITSPGRQASYTHAVGQLRGATGITVSFAGNEGQATLQQVTANAGSGSLTVMTALGGARPAKSIVLESIITAGGSVSIVAAETGNSGEAALETSRIVATGAIVVRSGPLGTTNVKLNTLRSSVLTGAYTGPSGSCTAENNSIFAPAREMCLP